MRQALVTILSYEELEGGLSRQIDSLSIRLRMLKKERKQAQQKVLEAGVYFGRVKASIEQARLIEAQKY